jgi:hypothetical protein
MWKSSVDLKDIIDEFENLESLDRLYSLKVLWSHAVYTKNYEADDAWKSLLVFTPYGQNLLDFLIDTDETKLVADFYLALFFTFSYHELIFDWQKTNISGIEKLLTQEIHKDKIRYPYHFGRYLYDRFNDLPQSNRTDHLLPEQVSKLLEGTPKGVYQVGYIVVGPLGVIDSMEPRSILPSLSLPLWHCSDTGCNAIHYVRLEDPKILLEESFQNIYIKLRNTYGPESEWEKALRWMYRNDQWENGRPFCNIINLIAETVIGEELSTLVETALTGKYKNHLRGLLAKPPIKKILSQRPAYEIARKLNLEQQLQLLITLPDNYLVESIDNLVYLKKIKIPIGEVRAPKHIYRGLANDRYVSLSSRGTRSNTKDPISQLMSFIISAYNNAGTINELEWRIRESTSANINESLFNYIRKCGPCRTINDLVLSSSAITEYICNEITLSMKHVGSDVEFANDRMLWKLGFDPDEFDETIPRIKENLRDFNEIVLSLNPINSEQDRQLIRASGVNLFVYLEDYLDRYISYIIWLLSSDHFIENDFCFDIVNARASVSTILGDKISTDNACVTWSKTGENALGTLLIYLAESIKWISSLDQSSRENLIRKTSDLPHYISNECKPFLFRHTQLWADADSSELVKFKERFISISNLILQANLAEIRNGIDHHRDENTFPDNDKMLACASRLQQAVESADINRFFPKYYWLTFRKSNQYGIIEYRYIDYAKRELIIYGPPISSGLPRKIYKQPVLVAPFNLMSHPNSQLIFRVKESSNYSNYWNGYPRRRKI